jgi:hypothetical protein
MIYYNCCIKTDTKFGELIRWTKSRPPVETGSTFASMKYSKAATPITQRKNVDDFPEVVPALVASHVTRAQIQPISQYVMR